MKPNTGAPPRAAEKSIPWWEPVMGPEEKELVLKVLESNYLNDGEVTLQFEQRLAKLCGVDYVVAVANGTSGIFLALAACGVKPGDEVIVPDVTFVATANAVFLAGAVPVLVDVRLNDFTMDPDRVKEVITPKTRAIVPVHVNGRAAEMEALLSIAKQHGLAVVEDAAETLGARWRGKSLGTIGSAGVLSFASSKLITTGQGGAVLTNDEKIRNRVREMKDQGRLNRGTGGADQHPVIGYNFKLTNLQSAVGLAQIEKLPARLEHLKKLHRWYSEGLENVQWIRLVPFDIEAGAQPQWIDSMTPERDGLADFLAKRKIQTRKFWFPIHTLPPYRTDAKRFPNAVEICRNGLWLPSAITLTRQDVSAICAAVKEFVS